MARLAKRPQPPKPLNLYELIALTKKAITENERYVAKDAKEIANFKWLLRFASFLYIIHIFFSVYFWKKGDDITMILLGIGILMFLSFIYFDYKKGTMHWVIDLEDKRKYLKELELRFSTSK